MRRTGWLLGWVFVFGALVAIAIDLFKWIRDGAYVFVSLGDIWAGINTNSLVGFGALIEKSVSPTLWSDILVPLLSLPAWTVLGAIAAILLILFRKPPRRRRHSFRS